MRSLRIRWWQVPLYLAIAALAFSTLNAAASTGQDQKIVITNDELSPDPKEQTEQIKDLIDDVFADYSDKERAIIKVIAACESGGKKKNGKPVGFILHVDENGDLIENPRSKAKGVMQLIPRFHSKRFRTEHNHLDVEEVRDNLVYARGLMEWRRRAGESIYADWYPSHPCAGIG